MDLQPDIYLYCKIPTLNMLFVDSFAHPHVRARLEKHMGSNLVSLTDKSYMNDLEDRIREVNEENLNKRISSRVVSSYLWHGSTENQNSTIR